MRPNIKSLLLSAIFLIILSTMNGNAVQIFAVSGIVTNPNGILVNGLEVTVDNQTQNIIGKSFTGETGDGRYDVIFFSFDVGSVGEIGDILNITIEMNSETLCEVTHILTAQNINDAHLNLDIRLQVEVPIIMLAVKPEANKTGILGRLKHQQENSHLQHQIPPKRAALFQNYPNPFNPETWIPYQLSQDSTVVISLYKTTGQLVRRLNLGYKSAGIYRSKKQAVRWDGIDEYGEAVTSGVYFYTIQASNFNAIRKMVILR
ncbi:T9SS type A sorting domain-containing protein [bacterium]|nr:T9SS type A sorting domain-containing protein [bacterium]